MNLALISTNNDSKKGTVINILTLRLTQLQC